MNPELLQLIMFSFFAAILSIKYLNSFLRGVKPVQILNRVKTPSERLVESLPVVAVGLAILLVLRGIFTPRICFFLGVGVNFPFAVQKAGFITAYLSFLLLISGYLALGPNWRVGTGVNEQIKLVTGGIFAYTRNPVYLFFNLFSSSLFLINGDYLLLGLFFFTAGGLHLVILREEVFLKERFGAEYERYLITVPRYFRFNQLHLLNRNRSVGPDKSGVVLVQVQKGERRPIDAKDHRSKDREERGAI